jgi:hypothetical protein
MKDAVEPRVNIISYVSHLSFWFWSRLSLCVMTRLFNNVLRGGGLVIPQKRWQLSIWLHDVLSQKAVVIMFTTMRNSKLTIS